jgi:pimeloyl-ACP methyl ester carboxylesterase
MGLVAFLPGAGGDPAFWRPVGDRLPADWDKLYFDWPGAGDQPHDPAVRGFDDLVARVASRLDGPAAVVAQSMGGVVAVRLALAHPEKVSRLVLAAISGGVDVDGLGASDWRPAYLRDFPGAASWILNERPDHSADLGRVHVPALLLWAQSDQPAGGRRTARVAAAARHAERDRELLPQLRPRGRRRGRAPGVRAPRSCDGRSRARTADLLLVRQAL